MDIDDELVSLVDFDGGPDVFFLLVASSTVRIIGRESPPRALWTRPTRKVVIVVVDYRNEGCCL